MTEPNKRRVFLRQMDINDLEVVLQWRNHSTIHENMFSQKKITVNQHRRWFEISVNDPSRKLLILELGGLPSGFVQFSGLRDGGVAEWGFYVAPGSERGTGRLLGISALRFGFETAQLSKVWSQVISNNISSIKFHKRLGFLEEGLLRRHHQQREGYSDIVCFRSEERV